MNTVIRYIKTFLLMLQFLTRIPINLNLSCDKEDFKRGIVFFPIVGFVVGGLQWLVWFLINSRLPNIITAILVVLAGVLITGALHIDGLGDTCDGFFSFKGNDKILEVMKDSRIGTYAALAIFFDIIIKIFSVFYIMEMNRPELIIAASILSRTLFTALFYFGKPAKAKGTGNLFIDNVGKTQLLISSILGISLAIILTTTEIALITYVIGIIFMFIFNYYCNKRINGLTGDTLGAFNELAENLFYLIVFFIKF